MHAELSRIPPPVARPSHDPARMALAINEMARSIAAALDISDLVRETVARTRELLHASGASLLLVDEKTGELYFDTIAGEGADIAARVRLRQGEGIAGHVAETAQAVLVADADKDPRISRVADLTSGFRTRSLVAAPLIVEGRVLGVVEAVSSTPGFFDEESLEALTWLTPHVALALRNNLVAAQLRASREEIRRANEVLELRVRQRTEQIGRAKREWEKTFDAIGDPLFLLDGFTVRRANVAFFRMAGVTPAAGIGKTCHQLLAGRATPCPGCPLVDGAGAGRGTGEVRFGGRTFRLSSFALEDGRVVQYQDVTEAMRLEQRLRESQRMASVGQLAAGAAHEINNPLGALASNLGTLEEYFEDVGRTFARVDALESMIQSGHAERAMALLRSSELVPAAAKRAVEDAPTLVAEARVAARRVADIVRALKELARESNGPKVVEDPLEIVRRAARRAEVSPERLEVGVHAPALVLAEPVQMELALANILKNAVQAGLPDAPIAVSTHLERGSVVVSVRDRGCGMPPEVRARAFDPFFTTRAIGAGVGLGLTAAWGIVTRHGGEIELDSEVDRGTTVRVRLPLAEEPPVGPG